jgi:large subunit ribosomal protein L32e
MAEISKRLMEVHGIGGARAQAIIDAGFDTIEKIRGASVEELSAIKGVSEPIARSIKEHFGGEEEPGGVEPELETVPEVAKIPGEIEGKEVAAEIVEEEEEVYLVKAKPNLPEETLAKLETKRRVPEFRRQEWFRYKRLGTSYRRPKGLHSKARRHLKYRPPLPRIGYRTQADVRGLHPSGFSEVMVYRPEDLDSIDPATEAARIGSTVGGRKRENIIELADRRGIRVLNRW